jgi:outer membrane receptor protein involved in Fe transport
MLLHGEWSGGNAILLRHLRLKPGVRATSGFRVAIHYFQDDWKVRPNLSLNLGLRWTYSSPFKTKYDQQSQFDPDATDPLTGLKGAITHPKGVIGKRDLNNFQPRVGLSWNFLPKWVFRGSFGVMTSDNSGAGGFEEYGATFNINQPTGDPRYVFLLKNGPSLRNPYIMNWSAGFQFQVAPTWLATATYQGTAGVGLVRSWNINQIPLSIALGNDRALQDKVFAAQQNYLLYPQFGSVNLLSNFNHNTWHTVWRI